MTDLSPRDPDSEIQARWGALKNSSRIWQDGAAKSEFRRGVLHPQLAKELYASPFEVLIDQVAKAKVWVKATIATELLTMNEKLKADLDKACHRLNGSDQELNDTRCSLVNAQKQLKGLLARGRKMEGDLLKAIRELELRTELPWKVVEYKETIGFKLGL
ncbi:hypothetical protein B296_00010054 [Ensete ventricosum]|uniref:Uncharacterized protein n=1 Tax=Ensete ventricosum TaxID=4639 RepID=A0A426ZUI9_ENSVE|nr:hypothetical protein B296_00010054 [Ensete ventricosum]